MPGAASVPARQILRPMNVGSMPVDADAHLERRASRGAQAARPPSNGRWAHVGAARAEGAGDHSGRPPGTGGGPELARRGVASDRGQQDAVAGGGHVEGHAVAHVDVAPGDAVHLDDPPDAGAVERDGPGRCHPPRTRSRRWGTGSRGSRPRALRRRRPNPRPRRGRTRPWPAARGTGRPPAPPSARPTRGSPGPRPQARAWGADCGVCSVDRIARPRLLARPPGGSQRGRALHQRPPIWVESGHLAHLGHSQSTPLRTTGRSGHPPWYGGDGGGGVWCGSGRSGAVPGRSSRRKVGRQRTVERPP